MRLVACLCAGLALALPAFALTATSTGLVTAQAYELPYDDRIVRVDCKAGRGTAFRVSPIVYLSVKHVTSDENCQIKGKPIRAMPLANERQDFAIITIAPPGREGRVPIDCNGFIEGREYVAIGFARGRSELTAVELVATSQTVFGLARLWGVVTIIPGQSGGPVFDKETWRAVGMVNRYNSEVGISASLALKDTEICRS